MTQVVSAEVSDRLFQQIEENRIGRENRSMALRRLIRAGLKAERQTSTPQQSAVPSMGRDD